MSVANWKHVFRLLGGQIIRLCEHLIGYRITKIKNCDNRIKNILDFRVFRLCAKTEVVIDTSGFIWVKYVWVLTLMEETAIDDPVKVWAFFDKGIFPIAMNWRRRLIKFGKLILITSRKNGQEKILTLICASDSANYELEYNTMDYSWKVKKVMSKD